MKKWIISIRTKEGIAIGNFDGVPKYWTVNKKRKEEIMHDRDIEIMFQHYVLPALGITLLISVLLLLNVLFGGAHV